MPSFAGGCHWRVALASFARQRRQARKGVGQRKRKKQRNGVDQLKRNNMTWNYRLMAIERTELEKESGQQEPYLEIRSCYYEEGAAVPHSYGDRGFAIGGDDVSEILNVFEMQKDACFKPILWGGKQFPQEYVPPVKEEEK